MDAANVDVDRLRDRSQLTGYVMVPDKSWVFQDEGSLLSIVGLTNQSNKVKLVVGIGSYLVRYYIITYFYYQVILKGINIIWTFDWCCRGDVDFSERDSVLVCILRVNPSVFLVVIVC